MTDYSGTELGDLAENLRFIAERIHDDPLVDHSGFTGCSIKARREDIYGEEQEILLWCGLSSEIGQGIETYLLDLQDMQRLARMPGSAPAISANKELSRAVLQGRGLPAWSAQLHAEIDATVIFTIPDMLASAFCAAGDLVNRIRDLQVESLLFESWSAVGDGMFQSLSDRIEEKDQEGVLLLEGYGLVVFGQTIEDVESSIIDIRKALEKAAGSIDLLSLPVITSLEPEDVIPLETAHLRKLLSERCGQPVLVRTYRLDDAVQRVLNLLNPVSASIKYHGVDELVTSSICEFVDVMDPKSDTNSLISDRCLPAQLMIRGDEFLYIAAEFPGVLRRMEKLMQFLSGMLAVADNFAPLARNEDRSRSVYFPAISSGDPGLFTGETALVSGAASGIGKAVAASLLERGACVIGLDINHDVVDILDFPCYVGIQCDLTDEESVRLAFNRAVSAFGGLDIMVLNAGVFPPSRMVSDMDMDLWRKVMAVNLDSNLFLLKYAYPLLKAAPRHGRVLFNASRNVPAPGPGAAAYSSSKAAFTQLARVTALEWGKDHIPVNIIHPHAVFDTGIWTQEVLESRAAKYGITVEEYKTNNVLGVELTSHDVGELVAEICGPRFAKITGAQIPVDGGSERGI